MGDVHLTDFGLAKATATGSRYTRTGEALGTPAYMAPEQARGETAALTPAADVWSLGCVLHELLAGRRAFEGDSPAAVIAAVLTREPVRVRAVRPDVPAGLETVVRVCLARLPGHRYADAGALVADLDRVARGETPRARPPRRPAGPLVAVACLCLAVGVSLGVAAPWRAGPAAEHPAPATAADAALDASAERAWARRHEATDEARRDLAAALAARPERDAWRIRLGLLAWAAGDPGQAQAHWAAVRRDGPDGEVARLYLGLERVFAHDKTGARPRLVPLAAAAGRTGALARGALAAMDERWGESRAALADVPGFEASLLRGYVESSAPDGDPARAIRELTDGMAEGLHIGWAQGFRAIARSFTGDQAGARADFEAVLARDPSDPEARLGRAELRANDGDLAGALTDMDAILQAQPGDGVMWFRRGVMRRRAGDLDGADDDFTRAVELAPEFPDAWSTRGCLRAERGDVAAGLADLDRAVALPGRTPTTFVDRAHVRHLGQDVPGALADLDAAVQAVPDDPAIRSNRALLRLEAGDQAGARADYEVCVAHQPDGIRPRFNLAVILAQSGEPRSARPHVDYLLRLVARDDAAWRARVEALDAELRAQGQ